MKACFVSLLIAVAVAVGSQGASVDASSAETQIEGRGRRLGKKSSSSSDSSSKSKKSGKKKTLRSRSRDDDGQERQAAKPRRDNTPIQERGLPHRVVQIEQTDGRCLAYDESLPMTPFYLRVCTTDGSSVDRWYQVPQNDGGVMFRLMHHGARECLPTNPEAPGSEFDCFESTGTVASGDAINGLVDCSNENVARIMVDTVTLNERPEDGDYLSLAQCRAQGVNLVSYFQGSERSSNGKPEIIMWGESVLLKESIASANGLNGRWTIRDASNGVEN